MGCENRCDRILWKGEGLNQMWYVRGESRFSDHRPVYSLFSVQVDMKSKNIAPSTATLPICCPLKPLTNSSLSSTCCATKVQAEEQLLLLTRAQSCIDTVPRFWVHKTDTRQRLQFPSWYHLQVTAARGIVWDHLDNHDDALGYPYSCTISS